MNFAGYVPAAVREIITNYLEGENDRSIPGYIEVLASAELELAKIEQAIEARLKSGEVEILDNLRKKRGDATAHRDMLAGSVDCLMRLAHDPQMRDAFAELTREFTNDKQWGDFIISAWVAQVDYGHYRDKLKRAKELKEKIADTATNLAKLLCQFSDTGVNGPDELYSIPELLRKTDHQNMQGDNRYMWRKMRAYVLGDPPRRDFPEIEKLQGEAEQSTAPKIVIRFLEKGEKPEIDPIDHGRDTLRYAWGMAPNISALLDTVSKAARDFEPCESGMIGDAIISRQRSIKTEYLRAFANRLTNKQLTMSVIVMRAIAIVATVVINLPDIVVTYDDVRKALLRRSG